LNSGQVELVDSPVLLAQLIGLVRRGDKIDHLSSEHDDHANAAAGALVLVAGGALPLVFRCNGQSVGMLPPSPSGSVLVPVVANLSPAVTVRRRALARLAELTAIPDRHRSWTDLLEREELRRWLAAQNVPFHEAMGASHAPELDIPFEKLLRAQGHWFPHA
jgi:hypothetical protein